MSKFCYILWLHTTLRRSQVIEFCISNQSSLRFQGQCLTPVRALQTHFFLSLSAQAYSGKCHQIPRPWIMEHISSERKGLQMSFCPFSFSFSLFSCLPIYFSSPYSPSLPLPTFPFFSSFPFSLNVFLLFSVQFLRGPLSLTFHYQTLAHSSACRSLASFLFTLLAPFLLNATPKGLSTLCCSNQLSVALSQFPFLNFWAGWGKIFHSSAVFHRLKSHWYESNQPKIKFLPPFLLKLTIVT